MEIPKPLLPMEFHGVVFTDVKDVQYQADCPFCGKAKHLFANGTTAQWDCKRCGRKGNLSTFYEETLKRHAGRAKQKDWEEISKDRKLPAELFKKYGFVKDDIGRWLIPVRSHTNKVYELQVWKPGHPVMETHGGKVGLIGSEELTDPERKGEPVYIGEGIWDKLAGQFLLQKIGKPGIFVAKPGATTFKAEWTNLFVRRHVILADDNDGAGDEGSKLVAKKINGLAATIEYVNWPETLPEGFDMRDFVTTSIADGSFGNKAWKEFQRLIQPHHRHDASRLSGENSGEMVDGKPAKKLKAPPFTEVMDVYKKWLLMTPSAVDALKVMFAVVLSNQLPGDPLWVFVVGPPGCGKTVALMSMRDAAQCVFQSKVTAQALISGWQASEDPSLIPQLNGKVLIWKDYTELLAMNPVAQDEVIGVLRGAYDGEAERQFANGVKRVYKSHFSMIAGVTSAIHGNSRAALGERFLKFQWLHKTTFKADNQIRAAISNISRETKMEEELRAIAAAYLNRKQFKLVPKNAVPKWVVNRVVAIAQLISMLRAKVDRDYTGDQIMFRPQQEVGTRLAKQLIKLGMGLAVVEDKKVIDEEVYRIMERVAFDTAIGFHLDIVQAIIELGGKAGIHTISEYTHIPASNLRRNLDDLVLLQVVRRARGKNRLGYGLKDVYAVTKRVATLWDRAKIGGQYLENSMVARRKRKGKRIPHHRGYRREENE